MKPNKEQMEAYKAMAKASPDSMKAMIEANLKETCDKFAGHEDRLDDCLDYLTACAREILGNKNGDEWSRNMKPGKDAEDALDAWLKKFKPKWRKAA